MSKPNTRDRMNIVKRWSQLLWLLFKVSAEPEVRSALRPYTLPAVSSLPPGDVWNVAAVCSSTHGWFAIAHWTKVSAESEPLAVA
jgi:hypothetical protein